MVKRPYYAYMLHRRRKLGTYREGLPPSHTATRVRGDMLAGALPAKRIPKDTVN